MKILVMFIYCVLKGCGSTTTEQRDYKTVLEDVLKVSPEYSKHGGYSHSKNAYHPKNTTLQDLEKSALEPSGPDKLGTLSENSIDQSQATLKETANEQVYSSYLGITETTDSETTSYTTKPVKTPFIFDNGEFSLKTSNLNGYPFGNDQEITESVDQENSATEGMPGRANASYSHSEFFQLGRATGGQEEDVEEQYFKSTTDIPFNGSGEPRLGLSEKFENSINNSSNSTSTSAMSEIVKSGVMLLNPKVSEPDNIRKGMMAAFSLEKLNLNAHFPMSKDLSSITIGDRVIVGLQALNGYTYLYSLDAQFKIKFIKSFRADKGCILIKTVEVPLMCCSLSESEEFPIVKVFMITESEFQFGFHPIQKLKGIISDVWVSAGSQYLLSKVYNRSSVETLKPYRWNKGLFQEIEEIVPFTEREIIDMKYFVNENRKYQVFLTQNASTAERKLRLYKYEAGMRSDIQIYILNSTVVNKLNYLPFKTLGNFLATSEACEDKCENTSVILYELKNDQLIQYHTEAGYKSTTWKSLEVFGNAFLMSVDIRRGLKILQHNIDQFVPMKDLNALRNPGLTNVNHIEIGHINLLILSSVNDESDGLLVYRMISSESRRSNEDTSKLVNTWSEISKNQLQLKYDVISKGISKRHLKNSATNVTHSVLFNKDLVLQSDTEVPVRDSASEELISRRLEGFGEDLTSLQNQANNLRELMFNYIDVHEDKNWPGFYNMSSIYILNGNIEDLTVESINGVHAPYREDLISLKSLDETLRIETMLFEDIIVENMIANVINNKPVQSYITLNGDHHMEKKLKIHSIKTSGLKIGGFIDGIKLSRDSLLLPNGNQIFTGFLSCSSVPSLQSLKTDKINDIELKELFANAVRKDGEIILYDVHITGDLIYPSNLEVHSIFGNEVNYLLSNILLNNIEKEQIVTGNIYINKLMAKDVRISTTLNDHIFSSSIYINSPKRSYWVDRALFTDVSADEILIQHSLNEIGVEDKKFDMMHLAGDQIITGAKTFDFIHLDNNHVHTVDQETIESEVQKVKEDLDTFYTVKTGLKTHDTNEKASRFQTIAAFIDVIIERFKWQENGTWINDETFSTLERILVDLLPLVLSPQSNFSNYEKIIPIIISGYQSFNAETNETDYATKKWEKVKALLTSAQRNLNLIEQLKKSMGINLELTKSHNRKLEEKLIRLLTAKLRQSDAFFSRDSFVSGLIAGFDLKLLPRINTSTYEEFTENKIRNARKLIFKKDLSARFINGVDLEKLFTEALSLQEKKSLQKFIFTEKVEIKGGLNTEYLQGHHRNVFATTTGLNMFQKSVLFRQPVKADTDIVVKGNINGLKLRKEAENIALIGARNQTFVYQVIFRNITTGRITSDSVFIKGTALEEFVLKNHTSDISGHKTFNKIFILNDVKVKHLSASIINGVDSSSIHESGSAINDSVHVRGAVKLKNLNIHGNLGVLRTIRTNKTRDKNLTGFFKRLVLRDTDGSIEGKVSFSGEILVKNLTFYGTFDGVQAQTFNDGWLMKMGDEVVKGRTVFKKIVARKVEVQNNILQGVNLYRLNKYAAKIDENSKFNTKVFFGNLTSLAPIEVSGFVQGHNLTEDAILNEDVIIIPSKKRFTSPVKLLGDLNVLGSVNNRDMRKTCEANIGTVTVEGSVHVKGSINAARITSREKHFPDNIGEYWMVDRPVELRNIVTFSNLVADSIFVEKNINGIYSKELTSEKINCDDEIFDNITVGKLYADEINTRQLQVQEINGEKTDLLRKIILHGDKKYPDNKILGNLSIRGNLHLLGSFNGANISNYCLSGELCEITGRKVFLANFSSSNVYLDKKSVINGIVVAASNKTSELKIVVNGSLIGNTMSVNGLVNGIRFDAQHILMKNKPQTMTGVLTVDGSVIASEMKSMDGLFNGLNLTEMYNLRHGEEIIMSSNTSAELKKLIKLYKNLQNQSVNITSVLSDQAVFFNGWEAINTLEGNIHRITPIISEWIADKSFSSSIAIISDVGTAIWNYFPSSKSYKNSGITIPVPGNCTTDVKGFYSGSRLFIATSANCVVSVADLPDENLVMYTENFQEDRKEFSYLWLLHENGFKFVAAVATRSVEQALVIDIRGNHCFLFLSKGTSNQPILCEDNGIFFIKEPLNIGFALQGINLHFSERKLLVLGNNVKYEPDRATVFEYVETSGKYEVLQEIQIEHLSGVSGAEYRNSFYLALIQQPFYGTVKGLIKIYRLGHELPNRPSGKKSKFELEQKITIERPVRSCFLKLPSNEFLLLILNEDGVIYKFLKKGVEKFRLDGQMFIEGASSLETWILGHSDAIYNLAVSVNSHSNVRPADYPKSLSTIFIPNFRGFL